MAEPPGSGAPAGTDPVARPEDPIASRSVEELLDLKRIGVVMSPDRARPDEAWGVLNPASARSRDGQLFLFPRVVAEGNYSRIARASVTFNSAGDPAGVERLGIVLEPRESYELFGQKRGGVEDPRVTYVPLLDTYIMTYTAFGPHGARIALAASTDLQTWDRLGLMHFEPIDGVDFNGLDNKDCVIFPLPVADPVGRAAFAILHRPIFLVSGTDGRAEWHVPPGVSDRRPSIWISYASVERVRRDIGELTRASDHRLVASPLGSWENHHIGSGAPPILTEEGWLLYYHGVLGATSDGTPVPPGSLVYQSGVMLLDRDDPRRVLYRSSRPVLLPQHQDELEGIVPNVVFPTAVDVRGHRVDVYYGAADERIAAATTTITASVLLGPSGPFEEDGSHRPVNPDGRARRSQVDRVLGEAPVVGAAEGARHDSQGEPAMRIEDAGERQEPGARKSDGVPQVYKRILVALDGSSFAESVLPAVTPLAQRFSSEVTLLRVLTPAVSPPDRAAASTGGEAGTAGGGVSIPDELRREAHDYLAGVQQRLEAEGLSVEYEISVGSASEAILRRASELGVDLIALTTHGRTGLDRILLGSVAEDVVRRALSLVLLVRVQPDR